MVDEHHPLSLPFISNLLDLVNSLKIFMDVQFYQIKEAFFCTSSMIRDGCPLTLPSPRRGEGRVRGQR